MRTWPLLLCLTCATALVAGAQRSSVREHSQWVGSTLAAIQKLQPGATRADLEKLFVTDGGISTLDQQTYVYRECPYIKVDVEFSLNPKGVRSQDTINAISKPYLAMPVGD